MVYLLLNEHRKQVDSFQTENKINCLIFCFYKEFCSNSISIDVIVKHNFTSSDKKC